MNFLRFKCYEECETRSQSRSGTLSSSRRSSRSSHRRDNEEGWRTHERVEEKLERMIRYDPAGLGQPKSGKQRLSPLIEVVEPTPPICRNIPIFGMTDLDPETFDLSDLSSNSSDFKDQNLEKIPTLFYESKSAD